jgi:hypothetical protein
MITERDRQIINFIEKIGFASINQIAKLFFKNSKIGYDLARRRLKSIKDNATYLKAIRNFETNELIYLPLNSTRKKISKHNLAVIDYLCELKSLDCDIKSIEIEKHFGSVIPDAFICFRFNGYIMYQLLEIELRHDFVDVSRYQKVLKEILKETNNNGVAIIPSIVIVQNTNHDYVKEYEDYCRKNLVSNDERFSIYKIDSDMSEIAKIFIEY